MQKCKREVMAQYVVFNTNLIRNCVSKPIHHFICLHNFDYPFEICSNSLQLVRTGNIILSELLVLKNTFEAKLVYFKILYDIILNYQVKYYLIAENNNIEY